MANRSNRGRSEKVRDRVSADTSAPGRVYGYIRVSTSKQDVEGQRYGILQWADERKVTVGEWVEETVSSRKSYRERALGALLERLQSRSHRNQSQMW